MTKTVFYCPFGLKPRENFDDVDRAVFPVHDGGADAVESAREDVLSMCGGRKQRGVCLSKEPYRAIFSAQGTESPSEDKSAFISP